MQELLLQMVDNAKKEKKKLLALTEVAIKCRQFELASKFREMEKELFPLTEEENKAKELAKEISIVFRMVKLNVSDDVCWLISETLKIHSKMEGSFSVNEASELIAKRNRLFDVGE